MKTQLIVTDLTRMQGGHVCIAGYNGKHECIRPVAKGGIPESILFQDGNLIIYPFALVELELLEPEPQPPHTEDILFNLYTPQLVREVHSREEVLRWSLFDSVETIFARPVLSGPGFYVMDCEGPRSLGTIITARIDQVLYEPAEEGTWDYRLLFTDPKGGVYRLKIVDLAWHYYCNFLRGDGHEPAQIAVELSERLRASKVYLRIGLARGWKKFPGRCYLQIAAVYSFPDYAEGKPLLALWPGVTSRSSHQIREQADAEYSPGEETHPW
jgi:hypothetical protein